MRLSDLNTGENGVIIKVLGHGGFRKRIMEMGFVRGQDIEVLQNAPLNDPIKYKVMDYEVSLRRSEASMIEVITREEAARQLVGEKKSHGSTTAKAIDNYISSTKRKINVALVGNPNSGKTSLFNHASGSHEHVGNYGGVTVDAKYGKRHYNGYDFDIFDLPGTYALSAYTPEEVYVRRHMTDRTPDVVINVVAASNLERNLYLTTELIDMNMPVVVALNMYDELEESGARLDHDLLGRLLGVPMVPTVSRSGKGIDRLFDEVIAVYEGEEGVSRHIHINHGPAIEAGITALQTELKKDCAIADHYSTRYIALKLLESDGEMEQFLAARPEYSLLTEIRDREVVRIEKELGEDMETAVADEKYGFIAGAMKETYTPGTKEREKTTNMIDSIVTHKFWGFPIFFLFMWIMFEATFTLGAYPMGWIESGVAALGDWISNTMADGAFKDLIVDGVIGGVGGVVVFLPNILILYLFISFMEDSGYMARAAFIMDKVMHRIGLHGKSFIPLIMGFGCSVPAIMSARTIESRSSRIITILINPFMSCSARLPVFILLAGTFFPHDAGIVLFGLYLLGIAVAVFTAKLLRKSFFKKDDTPFVMELPPYRMPTAKSTVRHMWEKAVLYLRKMGGIILIASICVWFLGYFPRQADRSLQRENSYIGRVGKFCEPALSPLGLNWKAGVALLAGTAAKEVVVSTLGVLYADDGSGRQARESVAADSENGRSVSNDPDLGDAVSVGSVLGVGGENTVGTSVENDGNAVNAKAGRLDENAVVAGITENAVSTNAYGADEVDLAKRTDGIENAYDVYEADEATLSRKLAEVNPATGKPDFDKASAMAFLVFVLLYFPCMATLTAVKQEAGGKWAAFSFIYNTLLAWLLAFVTYNIMLQLI